MGRTHFNSIAAEKRIRKNRKSSNTMVEVHRINASSLATSSLFKISFRCQLDK